MPGFMTDVMTSDVRSELESRLHHGHGDTEPLTTWGQVFLITLLIEKSGKISRNPNIDQIKRTS